ncbi:MAG: pyridoxal phosphate-dependent aminotransferase [Deltaproteobacteria bacterium]
MVAQEAMLPDSPEAEGSIEPPALAGESKLSRAMVGSGIQKIAREVREARARGNQISDLALGDFHPDYFPIPPELAEGVTSALREGFTNYPPAAGVEALLDAIADSEAAALGSNFSRDGIAVASGARPLIFATLSVLVDPGDRVAFTVPSWNSLAYAKAFQASVIALEGRPENNFMPTEPELSSAIRRAKVVLLASPQNPSGGVLSERTLDLICDAVASENVRRRRCGETPLYLLFDQVYSRLCFDAERAPSPLRHLERISPHLVVVDGISKSMAATGLRVGWAFGDPRLISRIRALLVHMGALAPHAEQVGVARFLMNPEAVQRQGQRLRTGLRSRLDRLFNGLADLQGRGLPVETIRPEGGLYLSARFKLSGLIDPGGLPLATDERIRSFLLGEARSAVVPFRAFGSERDTGWFRLSVGAITEAECSEVVVRLERAILRLGPGR